jgi:hypothetical protein
VHWHADTAVPETAKMLRTIPVAASTALLTSSPHISQIINHKSQITNHKSQIKKSKIKKSKIKNQKSKIKN